MLLIKKDKMRVGDIYVFPIAGVRGAATMEPVLITSIDDDCFSYIDSSGRASFFPLASSSHSSGIIVKQQSLTGIIGDETFNKSLQRLLTYSLEPKEKQAKQIPIHTEIAHPDTPA